MKIALASDLHLCFGSLVLPESDKADVLILAGDVFEAADLSSVSENHWVRTFFDQVTKQFRDVIWVAGNHEHYGTAYPNAFNLIKDWIEQCGYINLHFLEKESITIDGVTFHGATMWTDLKKGDPFVSYQVSNYMNDMTEIGDWGASDWYRTHKESLQWLSDSLIQSKTDKNIVVTHHHPTMESIPLRFRTNHMESANYGYASDLSNFILDHEIDAWCAGHIHDKVSYDVGSTKVLCNPRGYYGYEPKASKFELLYFEVK